MKRLVILSLFLILAACSKDAEKHTDKPVLESNAEWFVGEGQFNGSLEFGDITSGQNKIITVVVKNVGTGVLAGPPSISSNDFKILYQNCEILPVSKSCVIKIGFNPAEKSNDVYSAVVNLGSSEAEVTAAVNLPESNNELQTLLNGIPVQDDLINFGLVKYNQAVIKSIAIKNNHETQKNSLGNIRLSSLTSPFVINYDSCSGKVLKNKASCFVKVSLNGAGKSGLVSDTLIYGDLSLQLSAVVKNLETVAAEESSLNLFFNNQAKTPGVLDLGTWNLKQNSFFNFYIKNEGTDKGIVQGPLSSELLNISYNSCLEGKVLNPQESCLIKLSVSPQSKGFFTSNFSVQGNVYNLQSVVREPGDKIYCSMENAEESYITWNGTGYSQCVIDSCVSSHHLIGNQCDPNVISCSVTNGQGSQTWLQNNYGDCVIDNCNVNYHLEAGQCLSDSKICNIPNGQGTQSWNGFGYTNCSVSTCDINYHQELNLCVNDVQNCTVEYGSGTKQWLGAEYGQCQVNNCVADYHISNNQCVFNTQSCTIENGIGSQTWGGNNWNACQVVSCTNSFHQENNSCVADLQPCSIENGTGTKLWNGNSYNTCQVATCNNNFHTEDNLTCISNTRSCNIANGTANQSWNGSSWGSCNLVACNTNFINSGSNSCNATLVSFGTYKGWADGTYAKSCKEYKNPLAGYLYSGSTGDGTYRIKPNSGAAFDVMCDQTSNNGGWTNVATTFGTYTNGLEQLNGSMGISNGISSTNKINGGYADLGANGTCVSADKLLVLNRNIKDLLGATQVKIEASAWVIGGDVRCGGILYGTPLSVATALNSFHSKEIAACDNDYVNSGYGVGYGFGAIRVENMAHFISDLPANYQGGNGSPTGATSLQIPVVAQLAKCGGTGTVRVRILSIMIR